MKKRFILVIVATAALAAWGYYLLVSNTFKTSNTRNMHCHAILHTVLVQKQGQMTDFCTELFLEKSFQEQQLTQFMRTTYKEVDAYFETLGL